MACEHVLPSDMGYGTGVTVDSRIEACNKVIDHLMECLELASHGGIRYSAIRAALEDANSQRARIQTELDMAADEV